MCGGKVAHPILISLANIRMKVWNKALSHAFLLLALMPIPKFIHQTSRMCSLLEAHLFHQCMDAILESLKEAAEYRCMMSNPSGNLRYCFTPLISFIADTPEACMVACVQGQTSPVTISASKNFGDHDRHKPHTTALTLHQLDSVSHLVADIKAFFQACEPYCLSGVALPFWCDWLYAKPNHFLTPEALHYWHWQYWDHNVCWCRFALSDEEIDF